MSNSFSLYLSHSWRAADVDLNIYIWKKIQKACHLLVDDNSSVEPPYYINRIEQYIRRSDLFFAVLTSRPDEQDHPRCSRACLFEIRLAERARKPRFILYEKGIDFDCPVSTDYIKYEVFDREDLLKRGSSNIDRVIEHWLKSIKNALRPRSRRFQEASLLLLPSASSDVIRVIKSGLRDGGYPKTNTLSEKVTDFEVTNQLVDTGLLVVDLTADGMTEIHAMAHALFLPTIRIARQNTSLPWYLKGHPAMGYDSDMVYYQQASDLYEPVKQRAEAMRDTRSSMEEMNAGIQFFEQRRRRRHNIFISHAVKIDDPERKFVDAILQELKSIGVIAWEYVAGAEPGSQWKDQMGAELERSTDVVILNGKGFNDSSICLEEIEYFMKNPQKKRLVFVLPSGQKTPIARLGTEQQKVLDRDQDQAAKTVVEQVLKLIRK